MGLKVDMSGAIDALDAAISAFRDQLEMANRLVEQQEQALDTESGQPDAVAEQTLAKLQAERDGAEALRIQLESEVEKMRAEQAKTEARRSSWRHRFR
jgi:hypothetical protein